MYICWKKFIQHGKTEHTYFSYSETFMGSPNSRYILFKLSVDVFKNILQVEGHGVLCATDKYVVNIPFR